MVKDNNVHIKLEVCKDKSSGKLFMSAHFDTKAPNIVKEKDYYAWTPTIEEKNLLNEAFELMPTIASPSKPNEMPPKVEEKVEEKKEEKHFSKFFSKQENKIEPKIEIKEEIKQETKEESKAEIKDLPEPEITKNDDSDEFEVTDEETDKDDFQKVTSDISSPFGTIKETKDEKPTVKEEKISEYGEDDGIIVEADSDAIEAALKKHVGKDDDDSIVEADENTIIDRVLKQKKKGKWRN